MSELIEDTTNQLEAGGESGIAFEIAVDADNMFIETLSVEEPDTEFPTGAYAIERFSGSRVRSDEEDTAYEAARYKRSRHGRGVKNLDHSLVDLRLLGDDDFAQTA
jgi:hypothetical protein